MEAEIESEVNGSVVLDVDALNEIENECDGDEDCIKDAIKGLTRINHHSESGTHLSIEQPAMKKSRISYDAPNLIVEDEEWNKMKAPYPVPVPVPRPVEVPIKVPIPTPVPVPIKKQVEVKSCGSCGKPKDDEQACEIEIEPSDKKKKEILSQLSSESGSENESESESEGEIESENKVDSESESESDIDSDLDSDSELESEGDSEADIENCPCSAKKPTILGKVSSSQMDAMKNIMDNCWPENDEMKERHASGKTTSEPKAKNGWVSKDAQDIMECHDDWPEHKAVKE